MRHARRKRALDDRRGSARIRASTTGAETAEPARDGAYSGISPGRRLLNDDNGSGSYSQSSSRGARREAFTAPRLFFLLDLTAFAEAGRPMATTRSL